jgi:transposase
LKTTIKKTTQSTKDRSAPKAEIYAAPKPPAKGRIIGLDCHPDIFAAAVFRASSVHDARQLETRDKLSLESLLAWVQKEFTHQDLFLMEAGSNSFEMHRRLLALGLRAAVLESSEIGRRAKKYADNDKMAAARIVRVYLGGEVPCVWVPDPVCGQRRELLHAYQKAVVDHTAAVNAFQGYLNQFAIRLGKRGLRLARTRQWVESQRDWQPLQRALLADHFAQLDHAAERRQRLSRLIAQQVAAEPLMLRTMKLLGIGLINAFALLAIIGEIRRFARPEKLVAYLGLNPGQRDSGEGKRIKVGVGNRGRGDLRHLLVQSAQAILRMGRNTTLGQWGWKLFARKAHRQIAVAAVARKLVVQVWHLLSDHPPLALEASKSLLCKLKKLAAMLGKELRTQAGLPASLADCIQELQQRILQPNSA